VKFAAASLLVLCALATTACNTLVTRRDLYAPTKASGPYTTIYQKSLYVYGVQPQPHAPRMTPAPLPEIEPPLPGTEE
jgi:hypothetical protein